MHALHTECERPSVVCCDEVADFVAALSVARLRVQLIAIGGAREGPRSLASIELSSVMGFRVGKVVGEIVRAFIVGGSRGCDRQRKAGRILRSPLLIGRWLRPEARSRSVR